MASPLAGPVRRARALSACAVALWLGAACVWDPWIPGENRRKPEPVVDPATLSQDLALDRAWVDELRCFATTCEKRFRVIVEQPGQLTVTAALVLESQEQQARLVLEAVRGVLAQQSTGRRDPIDPPVLAVREAVTPGVYFVLLQTVGGRVPYELAATLTPDAGDGARLALEELPAPPPLPEEPLPPLTTVERGRYGGASYDPGVRTSGYRTFAFQVLPRGGEGVPAGTPVEQPRDRQIRRFLKEALELKGFRQATGSEAPDFLVGFSTSRESRAWLMVSYPILYGGYEASDMPIGPEVHTRGTLAVDIVDARTERLAWHAWTEKSAGPGVTPGPRTTALLRESVADVLAGFPPH